MEAVLQLGQWVGRVSWDPVLIPVLAAALLSQARGWEELTVPYFCQPAACPFWIGALCWGCTVCPTDGPGLKQPDCN